MHVGRLVASYMISLLKCSEKLYTAGVNSQLYLSIATTEFSDDLACLTDDVACVLWIKLLLE